MTRQYRQDAFSRAHGVVAANIHAAAERGMATFKDISDSAIAAASDRHDALTRFADNLWTSKKLFDDEIAHYCTENFEVLFSTLERMAQAKSAAEIVELQSDFVRTFTARVTDQARELLRLSVGASEHALQAVRAQSNSASGKGGSSR